MTTPSFPEWIVARDGFGDAWETLCTGPRRIAYLGLSVTAQRDGFRSPLHELLVRRTGHSHKPLNAGIGGVGSVSLAFLMDGLVLAHGPALCFVECTTGDIAGDSRPPLSEVPKSIEGIVRKLLSIDCRPCLLHLYRREVDWKAAHPVVAEYERIAEHYGIPSINVGRHVACAIERGDLDEDLLLRDVVHLTSRGGEAVAALIADAIDAIVRARRESGDAAGTTGGDAAGPGDGGPADTEDGGGMTARPHGGRIPQPLTDGRYDRAREQAVMPGDCATEPRTGRFRLVCPYVELDCDNALRFSSNTLDLKGLLVIVGRGSGPVAVSTPQREQIYDLRDRWSHYDRISTLIFDEPIPAGTPILVRPIPPSASLRTIAFLGLPS